MKKNVVILLAVMSITLFTTGCGMEEFFETESSKQKEFAMVRLPNGECKEGYVEEYTRWSNSCIEITMDGTTFIVHPANVAFIGGSAYDKVDERADK